MPLTSFGSAFSRAMRRLALSLPAVLVLTSLTAAQAHASTCVPVPPYATEADRIGVNVITDHGKSILDYDVDAFKAGWYVDYGPEAVYSAAAPNDATLAPESAAALIQDGIWLPLVASVDAGLLVTHGLALMPVLRLSDLEETGWQGYVGGLVDRNPGALWVIGNEMDRHGQDGRTPAQYAVIYRRVYQFIKQRDPTSRIAIGAVVQPTPLRRRYLDMVMDEYQRRYGAKLPVDVWNVHSFILQEKIDDWGASIPPGTEAWAHEGMLYKVSDHGDIEIMKQLVRDFRTWMDQRGYRNAPLIVSEYGILMPPDYDAGCGRVYDYAFVSEYMLASFAFFRAAVDAQTGLPGDGSRLVQAWSWYSLNDYVYSYPDRMDGFNGNLLDHDSGQITPLGKDFAQYASRHGADYVDLAVRTASARPVSIPAGAGASVTLNVSLFNRGNLAAQNARVRVWLGDPDAGGTLLGQKFLAGALAPRCRATADLEYQVRLPALPVGYYNLVVEAAAGGASPDAIPGNDRATAVLRVGEDSDFSSVHLPLLGR